MRCHEFPLVLFFYSSSLPPTFLPFISLPFFSFIYSFDLFYPFFFIYRTGITRLCIPLSFSLESLTYIYPFGWWSLSLYLIHKLFVFSFILSTFGLVLFITLQWTSDFYLMSYFCFGSLLLDLRSNKINFLPCSYFFCVF